MSDTDNSYREEIIKQITENISIKLNVIESHIEVIEGIVKTIIEAYKNNKKVIWFGNGGSAADAQHLACELVSKFQLERKAIPSISLTTNTSILTAISNDYDFENVFERQVEALAEKKDVLIGITTSGTSPNVIRALKTGRQKGTINIAFTGEYSDKIRKNSDHVISIPSNSTPRVQEVHILIGHIICDLVERTLFGDLS